MQYSHQYKKKVFILHIFSVNNFDEQDNEIYTMDFETKNISFLKN